MLRRLKLSVLGVFAVALAPVVIVLTSISYDSGSRDQTRSQQETQHLIEQGRYLATIGVCAACHTPPAVSPTPPGPSDIEAQERERLFRTDLDWFQYLDNDKWMAGGVPFILRFSDELSGIVYTKNLTPDPDTGLGNWTEDEIVEAIRTGKRKDGTSLFLFAPHTFFKDLAEEDARAIAVYLKSLPPIRNSIPERSLPFPTEPMVEVTDLIVFGRLKNV